MIVLNSTIKVHHAIEEKWLQWLQEEHIPEHMRTGLFTGYHFYRLLEQDDSEGSTYVLQYSTHSVAEYQQYLELYAPLLQQKAFDKWGDLFIAFRTIMQSV